MRIGLKISCLVVGTALLATATLTAIGYSTARNQYIQGIDHQLTATAAGLPEVISQDYLHRAQSNADLPPSEYVALVQKLNAFADNAGVYYVYAFTPDADKFVNLATSASPAERADNSWAQFRAAYKEPPQSLIDTTSDGKTRFAEYTDEFGSFRSIFVRHPGLAGKPVILGVDVSMNQIHADLHALVRRYITTGLLVSLLAGIVGIVIARRLARPLLQLSQEVDAWSAREFARDDNIRAHLESIAKLHPDEAGDLARRFVDVQDRLQTYIQRLTETTADKQKIEHQLEIARTIQEGLLPGILPKIPNFEITGWSKPADQTGGDYFDWVELTNGHIILTIGDVTGHGIGPALVTAASRAYARATFNPDEALDAAITRLNDLLHGDLKGERFVTLVACLLDPVSRTMKLVAAGHGPIMFYSCRRDTLDVMEDSQGMPLGVMQGGAYEAPSTLNFEPGDALVIVSDGFFEWMNSTGDQFGTDRLKDSILASCRTAQTEIVSRLRNDLASFNNGNPQSDDTTALIIRCIT